MEWVETTGKTVDEAKESALDQLGVAADEAEFEVVEEEKTGLFGRVRREARVRARVRPAPARAKVDRRRERSRSRGRGSKGGQAREGNQSREGKQSPNRRPSGGDGGAKGRGNGERSRDRRTSSDEKQDGGRPAGTKQKTKKGPSKQRRSTEKGPESGRTDKEQQVSDPVTLDQQADIVEDFLEGLLDAFDLDGDISDEILDEGDTLEVRVDGDDLGLLIGPRGNTLQAIQELARAALQRRSDGPLEGRLRLDVAGYRSRRREALAHFARTKAEEVLADNRERALEPMSPADRKIVHDTINDIDGVSTISEGEDSNRRVVIVPGD